MNLQHHFKLSASIVLAMLVFIVPTAALLHAESTNKPMRSHDFTDVPVTGQEFMEPYINAFFHQGITGGCSVSPLQYCPTNPVTRGSMAVFMGRALGYVEAETAGYITRAYFLQTSTEGAAHGVMGEAINGNGVHGISTNGYGVYGDTIVGVGVGGRSTTGSGMYGTSTSGIGVWGVSDNIAVFGESQNSYGIDATSANATALRTSGAGNLATDALYDIELGGSLGEIYGSGLHFFSDGGLTIDLDNNNNNNSGDEVFSIRNGTNTSVLTIDEGGFMVMPNASLHSLSSFVIQLDTDNNTSNSVFQLLNGDGQVVFSVTEAGVMTATGSKSAIVDTVSYGTRAMYAVEATEVWFEDMGSAQLVNGVAIIEFEAIFAETVNLEEEYQVFLTPVGGWAELYIEEQTSTSFTVRATDATSDLKFHYRIVAKRLGYEDVRLEEVED